MNDAFKLLIQVLSAVLILYTGFLILNQLNVLDTKDLITGYHELIDLEKNSSNLVIS